MTASLWEQKQITKDCFGGVVERNCARCPASSSRGGICCFGEPDKHDPEDPDCQECLHFEECRQEVIDTESLQIEEEAKAQNAYFSRFDPRWGAARQTKKIRSRPQLLRRVVREVEEEEETEREQLVQIGGRKSVITSPEEYKRQKRLVFKEKMRQYASAGELESAEYEKTVEGLFDRFWKDTAWGAGQGFFEMGAEFFRTHRLP